MRSEWEGRFFEGGLTASVEVPASPLRLQWQPYPRSSASVRKSTLRSGLSGDTSLQPNSRWVGHRGVANEILSGTYLGDDGLVFT